ncbi:hypothetical protein F4859DRAFT_523727 [Xylaria cf. heliscus]|nr:hypothetical protein F4859DRAFT_523727 [Xylaria cf. heliscus]
MCKGSKEEMLCGHVETHFSSACGKRCSSPQGATRYLDKPCPRCDPENTKEKRKARAAELLSQFRYKENEAEIQSLTERANKLNLSMRRGIAEAQHMMYGASRDVPSSPLSPRPENQDYTWGGRPSSRSGKAPWDPASDSESDDGRRDTTDLTADGKHVVEKQYKLINGHWALIAYRRELHEVDPYLLLKLREKREKELAKARKRAGKRRARDGEYNSNTNKNEEDSKTRYERFIRDENKAVENRHSIYQAPTPGAQVREKTSEPSSPRPEPRCNISRKITAREKQAEAKSPQEPRGRVRGERYESRAPQVKPEAQKMRKYESRVSLRHPANSFRARAEQDSFRPTPQWGVGGGGEYEREPARAESSAAGARRGLRRVERGSWMERFAEDITYGPTDSGSDADSVVTVIRAPLAQQQPGKESGGKSTTDRGKSRARSDRAENEEDLDMWHKIADEE